MKQTHAKRTLEYMERHGGITQAEAYEAFGCLRLSAIIFNLRDAGWPIVTDIVEVPNRYGKKCRVARYRLEEVTENAVD